MVQLTGAELGAANIKTVQKAIGDWGWKMKFQDKTFSIFAGFGAKGLNFPLFLHKNF